MRVEEKRFHRAKGFTPSILESGTPEAQKIVAKRERVMEAAFELMGQRGIRAVTMGDVSEYLRMSKRTIYEIFEDKEELLCAILQQHYGNIEGRLNLEGRNAMVCLVSLMELGMRENERICPQFFEDLFNFYPRVWSELQDIHRAKSFHYIVALLERGIREGVFRAGLDVEFCAKMTVESERWLANTSYFPREACSIPRLALGFESILVRGIATPRGLEELEKCLEELRVQHPDGHFTL